MAGFYYMIISNTPRLITLYNYETKYIVRARDFLCNEIDLTNYSCKTNRFVIGPKDKEKKYFTLNDGVNYNLLTTPSGYRLTYTLPPKGVYVLSDNEVKYLKCGLIPVNEDFALNTYNDTLLELSKNEINSIKSLLESNDKSCIPIALQLLDNYKIPIDISAIIARVFIPFTVYSVYENIISRAISVYNYYKTICSTQ